MYGLMLFLHLSGLFMWLGSLFAIVVTLLLLQKQLGTLETNTMAQRIIRIFTMFAHPGAVMVLISGVYMIIQMGMGSDKPLWLNVMERGGGMIILLALIFTSIMGSKLKKRLDSGAGQQVKLKSYLTTMSVFMVLIIAVVLVVSLRI